MGSYNYYKVLGCFTRKFKINEAEPPAEVKEAFRRYAEEHVGGGGGGGGSGGTRHMGADQLLRFMSEYQGDRECTVSDAEAKIQEVLRRRHHRTRRRQMGLTLEDFFYFLFQDDLNGPINSEVHHDMKAPLQHYYIYTGHNSYLTGNQLNSVCSETPIIRALENGVRGIELDLWPNSSKDDVHVLHGRTLTSPVTLIKCLKSIRDHAFVKSPYPVIITLEDHLTPDLQAKVAEMVTQVFGDMLYYPESESNESSFPSPEDLKHKIILSTKPPKEFIGSKNNNKVASSESEKMTSSKAELEADQDKTSDNSDQDEEDGDVSQQLSLNSAPPEYKRLIGIQSGSGKNGLKSALRIHDEKGNKLNRLSLNEQRFEKAVALYSQDVIRFTQKNLLRVYPKITRVTSSNFEPLQAWLHGTQMVAFNMQGYGKSLRMMHGIFRSNGGCGYVKKPDILMKTGPNNEVFDPKQTLPVSKTLKINIYAGDGWRLDFKHTHFDAYSPPDFYTKIYIVGVPADCAKKKTRVIEDEWTPHWDEEFSFPLTVPELALLRIEMREYNMSEKDVFAGHTSLLVSDLKPGIRSVPLYDEKGVKYKSVRVLMRFQFE